MALNDEPTEDEPTEDRGTHVTIWRIADGIRSFSRSHKWTHKTTVTVPIGWSFRPDPVEGVVLVNVFGESIDANSLFFLARERQRSFRIVNSDSNDAV